MIIYFADRYFNILGQASTGLPGGLTITDDLKTADTETGVAVFSCYLHFTKETQLNAQNFADTGNYLLRSHNNEQEFYTIIDAEIDTEKQTVYIYAEDAGMDLLNEIVGEYEADRAYPISHYVNKWVANAGFEIGLNEVEGLTKQLKFESEETVTARIANVAKQFDGCEISFSFEIDGLTVAKKYINIFKQRGNDNGLQLRLNKEIRNIVTNKTISSLATALNCEGGTPDDAEEPITLVGYSYDDGDFYVDGNTLKSREALNRWDRFFSKTSATAQSGGHITKPFSAGNALTKAELCSAAIEELKIKREIAVNYEADISKFPDNVQIGDRVNIIDDNGELYLSARLLKIEESVVDNKRSATLGEYLIKTSGISQKVAELAAEFAKNTISVKKAQQIASNAAEVATNAKAQAEAAAEQIESATAKADEAKTAADVATESAANAQAAAKAVQAAVDKVEESVSGIEKTVTEANLAANNAYLAADTATQKAEEAKTAAENAQTKADNAETAAGNAQTSANNAIAKADAAMSHADTAKTTAEEASATAKAAKLDAEQAEKDIAEFAKNLTTVENTMRAEYARKTDLTEAKANLQTQISQNAGQISSTASKVQVIDETANNAAIKAQAAYYSAQQAQAEANKAIAEAATAQTEADNARAAAEAAQAEADIANAAYETAKSVADKAEADLLAAIADLETVQSRADATEAEIAEAQTAVVTAQQAASIAKAEAENAAAIAEVAQTAASEAVETATQAQNSANYAAQQAENAQKALEIVNQSAASEAVAKAAEAQSTAEEAQNIANTAKTNAEAAQAKADKAAADAVKADNAAKEAAQNVATAQSDLEIAKQNLADILANVDATEEEIAEAQAAIETARNAVNEAMQNAATANGAAELAAEFAAVAQGKADEAKTAADNAQTAANEAKTAADKAQADVNALEKRVTTTETAITQNSEKIELRATKTEVTQAINAVEIGGRNLLPNTDFGGESKRYERTEGYPTEFGWRADPVYQVENGVEYTLSAKIRGKADLALYRLTDNGNKQILWVDRALLSETDYKQFSITFTVDKGKILRQIYICTRYGEANTFVGDWFELEPNSVKLEKGNKATDWTPAPEDIADNIGAVDATAKDIADRLSQAEATIKVLAEAITQMVRKNGDSSVMIQDENSATWYFDVGNIEETATANSEDIDTLKTDTEDNRNELEKLKGQVETYEQRFTVGVFQDEPCIILHETDTDKVQIITNTRRIFARRSEITNTETGEKETVYNDLAITDAESVNIGGWVWQTRNNGKNIGLEWKGAAE